MKRYVVELERLYAALLTDATYAYPALRREFRKDYARLTQLSHDRGISFYTIDLPALAKHLDRCVADGQYVASGLPCSRAVSGRVQIPNLFRGLYLLIFDSTGKLKEDADATAYKLLRQLLYCAKKADIECTAQRKDAAVANFVVHDSQMDPPAPEWATADQAGLAARYRGFAAEEATRKKACATFGNERGLRLLKQLDRITAAVSLTLGSYRPEAWDFKHGSGAVSDLAYDQNRYLFLNWSPRLDTVFPRADFAFHDFLAWADEVVLERMRSDEPTSKLHAVLKDLTKPRLITAEPSENMFCQQNVRQFMYERVAHSWLGRFIKFDDQSQNRLLALRGSLDGSVATLDMRNASDSIECRVVGNTFRVNSTLLAALAATRTRFCDVSQGDDASRIVELNKYSTMGNATTFPVQSLVFLSAALACVSEHEVINPSCYKGPRDDGGLVSIFGDDIIVPTKVARTVVSLLECLALEVNVTKSFMEGPFRESCGVDAFRGVDVTPAYWHAPCDGTPESYASTIETSNNFYKKFLVTAAVCIETQAGRIKFPRTQVNSSAFGFQTFCLPPVECPTRWSSGLQRVEYRVPQICCTIDTQPITDNTCLHQFFIEDKDPLRCDAKWSGGVRRRPLLKIKKRWVPSTQFLAEPTTS